MSSPSFSPWYWTDCPKNIYEQHHSKTSDRAVTMGDFIESPCLITIQKPKRIAETQQPSRAQSRSLIEILHWDARRLKIYHAGPDEVKRAKTQERYPRCVCLEPFFRFQAHQNANILYILLMNLQFVKMLNSHLRTLYYAIDHAYDSSKMIYISVKCGRRGSKDPATALRCSGFRGRNLWHHTDITVCSASIIHPSIIHPSKAGWAGIQKHHHQ